MPRRILIIGGGVIGLCTAHYLVERGHEVTIADRGIPNSDGCSFGNAGMIVPSHFIPLAAPGMVGTALKMMLIPRSPFYVKPRLSPALIDWMLKFRKSATAEHVDRSAPLLRDLHLASRDLYASFSINGDDFGLQQRGLLMLCKTRHTLDEEHAAAVKANRLGIPADVLDPTHLREREPEIDMDVAGGVYYPKDCHLSPGRLMFWLREKLDADGVRFLWNTEIVGWSRDGSRLIAARSPTGEIHADEFVLTAGIWSAATAKELGLRIPMQAGKGYSLTLPNPRQSLRTCTILAEARVAVTPMDGRMRFGGTMEMSGINQRIHRRRVEGITHSVPRYFPAFKPEDFATIEPWVGLRPCSPDGLPYIGRTKRAENLIVATGHAMMGVSLAPITGKLVSQIANAERPEINISLLSPDRFSEARSMGDQPMSSLG